MDEGKNSLGNGSAMFKGFVPVKQSERKVSPLDEVPGDMRLCLVCLKQLGDRGLKAGWFGEDGGWEIHEFPSYEALYAYCEGHGIHVRHGTCMYMCHATPLSIGGTRVQGIYMRVATYSLKPGMRQEDLAERYNYLMDETDIDAFHNRFGYTPKNVWIDAAYEGYGHHVSKETRDFLIKLNGPVIERYPENANKDTFDIIRIRFGIRMAPKKEQAAFAKKHIREVVSVARARILQNRRYQRYGVPPEFLKLDHALVTSQSELELVFVLPDLPGETQQAGRTGA